VFVVALDIEEELSNAIISAVKAELALQEA
jgi:hypothetical protein